MVTVAPTSDVPVRITAINFNASSIGLSYNRLAIIAVFGAEGGTSGLTKIRIDNCSFTGGEDAVEFNDFAYGVVDTSTFIDCSYGVVTYGERRL